MKKVQTGGKTISELAGSVSELSGETRDGEGEIGQNGTITIMAVDPGVKTGIAIGEFDCSPEARGKIVKQRISGSMRNEKIDGWEVEPYTVSVTGDSFWEVQVAKRIIQTWEEIEGEKLLAIEDFVLRPNLQTTDRVALSPVRITSALIALADEEDYIKLQAPSSAKGYATDERLKDWGLWYKGSTHVRDAYRHMCFALLRDSQ